MPITTAFTQNQCWSGCGDWGLLNTAGGNANQAAIMKNNVDIPEKKPELAIQLFVLLKNYSVCFSMRVCECINTPCTCLVTSKAERGFQIPVELELQTVVRCCVGDRKQSSKWVYLYSPMIPLPSSRVQI